MMLVPSNFGSDNGQSTGSKHSQRIGVLCLARKDRSSVMEGVAVRQGFLDEHIVG